MLLTIVICQLFLLYVFYKTLKHPKQDVKRVKQLLFRNDQPIVIAHRAGKDQAPENTLRGIRTAYSNGAHAVEVDLEFTKDGVAVLLHDETVERTTDGQGEVKNINFDELRKLNASAKYGGKFEQIPTLAEALTLCVENKIVVDLDVKSGAYKTVAVLKKLKERIPNLEEYVMITSFHAHILYAVRTFCPEFLTGMIWDPTYVTYTITGVEGYSGYMKHLYDFLDRLYSTCVHTFLPDLLGCSLIAVDKNVLSSSYIESWRAKGVQVAAWTVNTSAEKNFLLHHNVPVITDYIE